MLEKFRTETAGRSVGGTIRSSILRHVMRNGNFMVTEIAEATGYSLTTIAKYVAELQSDGMIAELERVNLHTKGRKAIRYGVNPDSYYFLGIDMKTFELNIALINFIGEVVRIERHTDFRFENTHDALDELCNRVQRFIGDPRHAARGHSERKTGVENLHRERHQGDGLRRIHVRGEQTV